MSSHKLKFFGELSLHMYAIKDLWKHCKVYSPKISTKTMIFALKIGGLLKIQKGIGILQFLLDLSFNGAPPLWISSG